MLAEFIAGRYRQPTGPRRPDEILVSEVLIMYGKERAPQIAAPERAGYAIKALLPFWGDRCVSTVRGETCREYLKFRQGQGVGPGTVRRELGTLATAVNWCHSEGRVVTELWGTEVG